MQYIQPIYVCGKLIEISGKDSEAEVMACARWLENHAGATRVGNLRRLA